MRKAGYEQNKIAQLLDRSEGTISREIRRNSGGRGYRHKQAHALANQRRFDSRKRETFTPAIQWAVEEYLREDLSPEQVTGIMRRKGEETVSTERIYQPSTQTTTMAELFTSTYVSLERNVVVDSAVRIAVESSRTV